MTDRPVTSDPRALEEVRKGRLLIDRCDAYLFDQIRPFLGKRVLEVGSGNGNIVPHLLDRQLVVATDIEPQSVAEIRRCFGAHANVTALALDICSETAADLRPYNIDTVLSLNVLEHIHDDGVALSNIANVLSAGGRLIIIVPAYQALYGTMDASIGHYRRYTKGDLGRKLSHAGFQVERQFYYNILGIAGWFVNGRLLRRRVPPTSQLRLYNLVFPIASRLESLVPPIVGLSLVSVSRLP